MKVLLFEDIKKLGWLGDVVEVNDGYARNYLIPKGLARIATEGNIRSISKEKATRAEQRLKERKRLERAAEAVDGAEAVLAAKANELIKHVGTYDVTLRFAEGLTATAHVVVVPEQAEGAETAEAPETVETTKSAEAEGRDD